MIKVGMLVEVVNSPLPPWQRRNPAFYQFVGYRGTVTRQHWDGSDFWAVDDLKHGNPKVKDPIFYFRSESLRPIHPDTKDIEETRQAGIQSWDGMMKELGKVISG